MATTQEKRETRRAKRLEHTPSLYEQILAESKKKSPRYANVARKAREDGLPEKLIFFAFDAAVFATGILEPDVLDKVHDGLTKAAAA